MSVFNSYFPTGFACGVAAGAAISLWWYNRPSIYERVKLEVDKEKKNTGH